MNWITEILTGNSPVHTIIALSLICALGLALGKVRLMGVSLGVAFVFFINSYKIQILICIYHCTFRYSGLSQ